MVAAVPVLIDTCVWAEFFNRRGTRIHGAVHDLIEQDRAALIGPVVTEILIGFRRDPQAEWVAASLRGGVCYDLTWRDWCDAARLGRALRRAGHTLPLTDLALSTVALARSIPVATIDPHFDSIPGLSRFNLDS